MRITLKVIAILCLTLMLCSCTAAIPGRQAQDILPPDAGAITPVAEAPEALRTDADVLLYFQYANQPYLAQEMRTVKQLPSQAWEQTLINALLSGPEPHSTKLSAIFPDGTQLISTAREGRTLFVTLSSEIMNAYPDEPANWRSDAYWSREVPLRRLLCMQSLVATVTENSEVDRIQVLVAQSAADGSSRRLPQSYFMTTDSPSPAAMLTRDGNVLLTPETTMRIITDAWRTKDWSTLYQYITEDGSHLDLRNFSAAMDEYPGLIDCSVTSGSISADGQTAFFAITATLQNEQNRSESGMIRLMRSGAVWCITLQQLTGWLEE